MLAISKEVQDYEQRGKTICNTSRSCGTDLVRIVCCGAGTAQAMRERVLAELYGRGKGLSWRREVPSRRT